MKEHTEPRSPLSVDNQNLVFLVVGRPGAVYAIDEERVLEEVFCEGINLERRAFEHLGSHTNVVTRLGTVDNGLILERGPFRTVIRGIRADQIPWIIKARWLGYRKRKRERVTYLTAA